jgi:hypothetical protein
MGQQQTVAEQAGGALRRTILALLAAALLAVVLAVMAAPAFAISSHGKGVGDDRNNFNNSRSSTGLFTGGDDPADTNGNNGQRVGDWHN